MLDAMLRGVAFLTLLTGCGLLTNTDGLSSPPVQTSDASATGDAGPSEAAVDASSTAIVYRGVQTVDPVDGAALDVRRPSAVQPGDFMLLALFQYNPQAQVGGLDASWQALTSLDPAGSDGNHGAHSLRILWKIAGDEPPAYHVTMESGAGPFVSGILAAWGGVDRVQPIDVHGAVAKDYAPFAVPSVATNFVDEHLAIIVSTTYGKGATWMGPDGANERASTGVLGLFEAAWPVPSPTGAREYKSSATYNVGSGAAIMALKPK